MPIRGSQYSTDIDAVDAQIDSGVGAADASPIAQMAAAISANLPGVRANFLDLLARSKSQPELLPPMQQVIEMLPRDLQSQLLAEAGIEAGDMAAAPVDDAAVDAQVQLSRSRPFVQNPVFALSTPGGAKFRDSVAADARGAMDRTGSSAARAFDPELFARRQWQYSQVRDTPVSDATLQVLTASQRGLASPGQPLPDAVLKALTDEQLASIAGEPPMSVIARAADAAQRAQDARIGGSLDADEGVDYATHAQTGLATDSTQDKKFRLLMSLLDRFESGDRGVIVPVGGATAMFPWTKARFPQLVPNPEGVVGVSRGEYQGGPNPRAVEISYPKTMQHPFYISGQWLDSLNVNDAGLQGRLTPLAARSMEHWRKMPVSEQRAYGRKFSEADYANQYLVPELKNGIPVMRRVLELEGKLPATSDRMLSPTLKSLQLPRYMGEVVPQFTDLPVNRDTAPQSYSLDALLDRDVPDAQSTQEPPVTPQDTDVGYLGRPIRNRPPQTLLQTLLA